MYYNFLFSQLHPKLPNKWLKPTTCRIGLCGVFRFDDVVGLLSHDITSHPKANTQVPRRALFLCLVRQFAACVSLALR